MKPHLVTAADPRDTTDHPASVPGVPGGWPSRLPALVATALVIAMSAAVLLWRLLDTFSYLNDDLIQFDVASRTGLSRDLLLMNVFQHFGPVNRALHLMLFSVGELDPNFGALTSVLLVVCLLGANAWLAAELGLSFAAPNAHRRGDRWLAVPAGYRGLGGCHPAHPAGPDRHLSGGGVAVAGHPDGALGMVGRHSHGVLGRTAHPGAGRIRSARCRPCRYPSRGHAPSTAPHWPCWGCAAAATSPVSSARPRSLLLWRGDPWRRRLSRLWALRISLLAMTSIGGVAALLILQNYVTPGAGKSSLSIAGQTTLTALTSAQFPQLVGYQPDGTLGLGWQLIVLFLIVVAAGGLIAMNRRNSGPVLFFLAVFVLYWGFLAFSPILNEEGISGTATRLHNAVYLTVPAYLVVFSLEGPAARFGRPPARRSRWVDVGVVGLIYLLVTLAGNIFTASDWPRYRSAHQYWEGLTGARAVLTDPDSTVVPIQAPASVADSWALGIGRQEFLFSLVDPGWQITALQDRTVIIDAGGELRNVQLQPVAAVAAGSANPTAGVTGSAGGPGAPPAGSSCLQSPSTTSDLPVVSKPGIATEPLYARLGYTSDSPGKVWVIPSSAGVRAAAGTSVEVAVGTHDVLVPLLLDEIHGMPVDGVPVQALQVSPVVGNSFCINSLSVVTPVVADPDGSCWNIDGYGTQTGIRSSCPG